MTTRSEQLTSVTSSSDAISKLNSDAVVKQSCSGNIAFYKLSRTAVPAGVTIIPSFIQMKPPCTYSLYCRWQGSSNNGFIYVIFYIFQINQQTPGGLVGSTAVNPIVSESAGSNTVAFDKTIGQDAITLTINNTLTGGLITDILDIELHSNKNF